MPSSERIVRSVSASSPIENAALSLSRPWPGMSTIRSRGSDIIAVAPLFGSSRTRIIVSDRVGLPCCTSILRRSSPMTRIVCGLPGATSCSCERTCTASGTLSSLMIELTSPTSSSTADATVAADSVKMTTAPTAKRLSSEKPERPGSYGSGNTSGGVRRRGASAYAARKELHGTSSRLRQPAVQRLQRLVAALEPDRELADEVAKRAAVVLQRGDRHPLVGAVVAAADRAELDRGDAGL